MGLDAPALPARFTRPSRLVGRLLCVRWVFRRWRVCRAVIAGSCLRTTESHRAERESGWSRHRPSPARLGSSLGSGAVPELRVQEGVVVEDEGLQVDQAPHLWGETLQLVVAQVQVEQVRQVDEELVGDGVDAAGIWGNSGLPGTCTSPGSPSRRGREQDPEQSVTSRGGHGQEGEMVTLAWTHLLWPRLRTSMFLAFSSSRGHSVSWL